MHAVSRTLGLAATWAAVLSLAACAPVRVNASLERGVDFGRYHSYAWAPDDRFSTGDPRLDNNEFFENRLKADVEHGLGARGLEKTTAATAALIIHYHARVMQKMDVNELDRQYGYCTDCHSSIYDAGTITIDMVDASTNRLVWRGWSEGSLDGIDHQALLESRVDDAVTRILARLPPGL
jgi:hypothetical protein